MASDRLRHSFSGTLIVKYIFTPGISSRLSQFLVILRHDFVLGMAILTCEVNLSQALGKMLANSMFNASRS